MGVIHGFPVKRFCVSAVWRDSKVRTLPFRYSRIGSLLSGSRTTTDRADGGKPSPLQARQDGQCPGYLVLA